MDKLLVLVGPTSSGKSELAVKLAKKFNGEIISADSRQIYKGMDLGTGKVTGKWIPTVVSLVRDRELVIQKPKSIFSYKGVAHYLIDFSNPKSQYSADLFQRHSKKTIGDILRRGKLPIICGGTAHWIYAVVYSQEIPKVKPNPELRLLLEKKSADDLYHHLKKLDPTRAANIDRHNKRRLIRALEIIALTGKPVPQLATPSPQPTDYQTLWLAIKTSRSDLYKKIDVRLKQRLKSGMVNEVARLHKQGLSWKKLESFGLEYKYISLYLQKKLSYDEMLTQLSFAIKHYSKRQLTWWKRNKEIKWIKADITKSSKLIEKFLK